MTNKAFYYLKYKNKYYEMYNSADSELTCLGKHLINEIIDLIQSEKYDEFKNMIPDMIIINDKIPKDIINKDVPNKTLCEIANNIVNRQDIYSINIKDFIILKIQNIVLKDILYYSLFSHINLKLIDNKKNKLDFIINNLYVSFNDLLKIIDTCSIPSFIKYPNLGIFIGDVFDELPVDDEYPYVNYLFDIDNDKFTYFEGNQKLSYDVKDLNYDIVYNDYKKM